MFERLDEKLIITEPVQWRRKQAWNKPFSRGPTVYNLTNITLKRSQWFSFALNDDGGWKVSSALNMHNRGGNKVLNQRWLNSHSARRKDVWSGKFRVDPSFWKMVTNNNAGYGARVKQNWKGLETTSMTVISRRIMDEIKADAMPGKWMPPYESPRWLCWWYLSRVPSMRDFAKFVNENWKSSLRLNEQITREK